MDDIKALMKTCPKCGLIVFFSLQNLADINRSLEPIWQKCPNCGDANVVAPARMVSLHVADLVKPADVEHEIEVRRTLSGQ